IADCCFGGADRDRTGDPLLAKQVLSQLSYSPVSFKGYAAGCSALASSSRDPALAIAYPAILVGLGRIELPTSPLSGVRSSQLSYRPVVSQLATSQQGLAAK